MFDLARVALYKATFPASRAFTIFSEYRALAVEGFEITTSAFS